MGSLHSRELRGLDRGLVSKCQISASSRATFSPTSHTAESVLNSQSCDMERHHQTKLHLFTHHYTQIRQHLVRVFWYFHIDSLWSYRPHIQVQ